MGQLVKRSVAASRRIRGVLGVFVAQALFACAADSIDDARSGREDVAACEEFRSSVSAGFGLTVEIALACDPDGMASTAFRVSARVEVAEDGAPIDASLELSSAAFPEVRERLDAALRCRASGEGLSDEDVEFLVTRMKPSLERIVRAPDDLSRTELEQKALGQLRRHLLVAPCPA